MQAVGQTTRYPPGLPLMRGVRFPPNQNEVMPNQASEEVQDVLGKGGAGRRLVWVGVSASLLILGIVLYSFSDSGEEGKKLRQFCDKTLDGMPTQKVTASARELGFDVRELKDTLLITVAGQRLGQSCFLTIVDGSVSDVHSVVTH